MYDPLATEVQPSDAMSTATPAPVPTSAPVPAGTADQPAVAAMVSRGEFQSRGFRGQPSSRGSRQGTPTSAVARAVDTMTTSVTDAVANFRQRLGLQSSRVGGAEVQLGPVAVPTTMDELKKSMDSLRQTVTGSVGHRADPRVPRRRRLGAQVGQVNTTTTVLLVLLAVAVVGGVIAGFLWNRKNLKRKLSTLRQDIQRSQ